MKRKTLILILILEAALIAGLVYLSRQYPAWFSSVWSIPMEQIAGGLKVLSGTGAFGNGLALAILAGIALIPVIIALRYPRGRETLAERITLAVMAPVILIVLWYMIHPGNMRPEAAGADAFLQVARAALSLIIWSVVILFVVLRLIRLFRAGKREQLLRYFRILLAVSCITFTAELAVTLMNAVLTPAADGSRSAQDIIAGIFRLAAGVVPLVFDIVILIRVMDLIWIAETEEQEGLAETAKKVSGISCIALAVSTGLCALQHVVQLLLMPGLTDLNVSVDIPVVSIVFVAVILLFTRLLVENRQLREDNSLFI